MPVIEVNDLLDSTRHDRRTYYEEPDFSGLDLFIHWYILHRARRATIPVTERDQQIKVEETYMRKIDEIAGPRRIRRWAASSSECLRLIYVLEHVRKPNDLNDARFKALDVRFKKAIEIIVAVLAEKMTGFRSFSFYHVPASEEIREMMRLIDKWTPPSTKYVAVCHPKYAAGESLGVYMRQIMESEFSAKCCAIFGILDETSLDDDDAIVPDVIVCAFRQSAVAMILRDDGHRTDLDVPGTLAPLRRFTHTAMIEHVRELNERGVQPTIRRTYELGVFGAAALEIDDVLYEAVMTDPAGTTQSIIDFDQAFDVSIPRRNNQVAASVLIDRVSLKVVDTHYHDEIIRRFVWGNDAED